MSYTLTAYLVDLDLLRRAVGSRDASLLAAVVQGDPDRLAGNADNAPDEDRDEDDEVPLGLALRHLVLGEPLVEGSAHQYGYALEALCRHLGEPLWPEQWSGVRWAVVEDAGLADTLTGSGPPVPLPRIDDFPTIATLPAAEVAARVARLGDGRLTHPDPDLQALLAEYEGWLRRAAAAGRSLVLIYC